MKRLALALTVGAVLAGSGGAAGAAQELPKPRVYTRWCGSTVVTPCAYCIALGTTDLACVPV